MLQISEGFILDDAGNLASTFYVDLREKNNRIPIQGLEKHCKRKYALEDCGTILISKPKRFRDYGEELIEDELEGLTKKETRNKQEETPEESAHRRAISESNEIMNIADPESRYEREIHYERTMTEVQRFTFGNDYWIYCTSISSADSLKYHEYDHITKIGQPAKFAQALARMVTEQLGPHGDVGSATGTFEGEFGASTKHKTQIVIHGPVVYLDESCRHSMLMEENNKLRQVAAQMFVKPIKFEAQQEYRFVILNGGADECAVELKVSGMMRDALMPMNTSLTRKSPSPEELVDGDGNPITFPVRTKTKILGKQSTSKNRQAERKETRFESKSLDKQKHTLIAHKSEKIEEITTTVELKNKDVDNSGLTHSPSCTEHNLKEDTSDIKNKNAEEVSSKRHNCNDENYLEDLFVSFVHPVTGQETTFSEESLLCPTFPLPPSTNSEWLTCTKEEIVGSFGAVWTLSQKVARVSMEHRIEAASACYHAVRSVNALFAMFGNIVDKLWIEKDRFAVILLKESPKLKATGRIVIGPSGIYTCHFRNESSKVSVNFDCKENTGQLFTPVELHTDTFEEFGWARKHKNGI